MKEHCTPFCRWLDDWYIDIYTKRPNTRKRINIDIIIVFHFVHTLGTHNVHEWQKYCDRNIHTHRHKRAKISQNKNGTVQRKTIDGNQCPERAIAKQCLPFIVLCDATEGPNNSVTIHLAWKNIVCLVPRPVLILHMALNSKHVKTV